MVEGRYFAPGTSRSTPARLWSADGGLRLQVTGEAAVIRPQLTAISDNLGRLPRKLTFADGSVFETPGSPALDALVGASPVWSRVSRWELDWRVAVGAVVAVLLLVTAFYRWGIPVLADLAVAATPPQVAEVMGRGSLDALDRAVLEPSRLPAERQAAITAQFDELARLSGQTRPALKLQFRDGGRIGANALALPGGEVVLTDQLVAQVRSPDELLGVLAHEIGHVQGEHHLRQIYRVLGVGLLVAAVVGDASQLVDNVVNQAVTLQSLSYTRQFERDADRRSVELMLKAKRDPSAFVDLIGRLAPDGGAPTGWLQSHPSPGERRQMVRDLADQLRDRPL